MDGELPATDWVAELDQMVRGIRDIAKVVYSYYEGLVDAGFTEAQALRLAAWWIKPPDDTPTEG